MNPAPARAPTPACATTLAGASTSARASTQATASAMPLPPDRSHVRTEHRNPASAHLDTLDAAGIAALMVDDHRAVIEAVAAAAPAIGALVEAMVPSSAQVAD